MTTPHYYVDKQELHEAMIAHLDRVKEARAAGKPDPKIPDYIGKAIINICVGLSMRYNFRGYTWRDEMVEDGIAACIYAVNKYNPRHDGPNGTGPNPYGYFTQCAFWAFQSRIVREKTELAKRLAILKDFNEELVQQGMDGEIHDVDRESIIAMFEE